MANVARKEPLHKFVHHSTKRRALIKFALVLTIFISYFYYVYLKFGVETGFVITILTWSFFVLATPVADAGFLLDFPLRLAVGVKMIYTETLVWLIAISVNLWFVFTDAGIYGATPILELLYKIITTPYPYWIVIILSATGTFLSIYFADELVDTTVHKERVKFQKHKHRYALVALLALFALVFVVYLHLVHSLNINFLLQ